MGFYPDFMQQHHIIPFFPGHRFPELEKVLPPPPPPPSGIHPKDISVDADVRMAELKKYGPYALAGVALLLFLKRK